MTASEPAENIVRAFERAASMKPGKVLVAGEKTLTYGELLRRAELLTGLFRKGGLSPGDRAVVSTADDIEAVTFFLSLLRNGITAVMIDPETPAPQARALISAARPKAVFLDSGIRGGWRPDNDLFTVEIRKNTGGRDSLFDKLIKKRASSDGIGYPAVLDTLCPAAAPADIPSWLTAYVIFTSGTTSRPRGVEISHGSLFHHLGTLSRQFGYGGSSRIMNVLPLHHADGLIQGPVVAFFNGCSVHRPMPFTVQNIHGLLDRVYSERITHLVAVPTMLSLIHRFAGGYEDCFATEDFRFIISTAAYLEEGLWRDFEERFRTRIANVYGLTETVAGSFFSGPGDDHRIGTIGKPADCAARIVDESGRTVPPGSAGELEISGGHLMKGYLDDPGATSGALKDGWLLTGDIAIEDDDGFYRIAGRKKNVIISGGINVHPEEVSEVLKAHPSVIDAVTFGVKDEVRGERIISCVTLSSGAGTRTQDLVDFCRAQLAPSKAPERVHILPELPKGPSGKVIIDSVRRMVTEAAAHSDEDRGRDLRSRVFSAAARSFRVPASELTPNSNSSNTPGWDSLGHIEFAASLEEEFGVALATVDILSIRSLMDAERIIGEKYLGR